MENQLRETLARALSMLANKPDASDVNANQVESYADLAPVRTEADRILGLLPAKFAFAALKNLDEVQVMGIFEGGYYGRGGYGDPMPHSPESYGPVLREVYTRLCDAGYKRQLSFKPAGGPNFHLCLRIRPSSCL